jgi:hypothetical protein
MHDGIAHDITTGGHDAFAPRPPSESLAAAIPGATIEIVEECDHVMFHQRPAEFNQRAIRLFAGSRRRRRSITSGGAIAITRAGVRRVNPAFANGNGMPHGMPPAKRPFAGAPADGFRKIASLRGEVICKTIQM